MLGLARASSVPWKLQPMFLNSRRDADNREVLEDRRSCFVIYAAGSDRLQSCGSRPGRSKCVMVRLEFTQDDVELAGFCDGI